MGSPSPAEIIAAREAVMITKSLGITAAQDWCADQVHVARRTWQSWEYGDRAMLPGLWELLSIKLRCTTCAYQEVRLSVENGCVIVEPISTAADLTLEDRRKGYSRQPSLIQHDKRNLIQHNKRVLIRHNRRSKTQQNE